MSLLQQVQRGRSHLPPRILVYGTEGVGKSSLAATTPKPIFIQTEDGLGEIDCDKFPLSKSLEDVVAALTELETQQHDYQTVAIDSLDWLDHRVGTQADEVRIGQLLAADLSGSRRGIQRSIPLVPPQSSQRQSHRGEDRPSRVVGYLPSRWGAHPGRFGRTA